MGKGKQMNQRGRGPNHLPAVPSSFQMTHTFRFQSVDAGNKAVTLTDVLNLWQVWLTATTSCRLIQSFRILHVEVWGPMTSSLVPVTVAVDWSGVSSGLTGNSLRVADTSIGATEVAHVFTRPPRNSTVSTWQSVNGSGNLFTVTSVTNAIVDFRIQFTLIDLTADVVVNGSVPSGTAGMNYIRALDSSTTADLVPLDYPTL